MIFKKFWQDSNGENNVLFTQKGLELFVYHYLLKNDQVKLLRKIYDFEEKCEFDLTLKFLEKSIGEITFAYQKSCRSGVSPLVLKLLIYPIITYYIHPPKKSFIFIRKFFWP